MKQYGFILVNKKKEILLHKREISYGLGGLFEGLAKGGITEEKMRKYVEEMSMEEYENVRNNFDMHGIYKLGRIYKISKDIPIDNWLETVDRGWKYEYPTNTQSIDLPKLWLNKLTGISEIIKDKMGIDIGKVEMTELYTYEYVGTDKIKYDIIILVGMINGQYKLTKRYYFDNFTNTNFPIEIKKRIYESLKYIEIYKKG